MKKSSLLFLSLLAGLVACQKENVENTSGQLQDGDRSVVYVTMENTKATFNGTRQVWESGDKIVLYRVYNASSKKATPEYFSYVESTSEGAAKFVADAADAKGESLSKVYAVYPAVEADIHDVNDGTENAYLTVSLPSSQTYKENSFDTAANFMTSVSTDPENISFVNGMGYLGFSLKGNDVSLAQIFISSVSSNGVKPLWFANAKVDLTGEERSIYTDATISAENAQLILKCNGATLTNDKATEFIVVLPAGTYDEGFKVRFLSNDGHTAVKTIGKTVIGRSQLYKLPTLNIGSLGGVTTVVEYTATQALSTDGTIGDFLDVYDSTTGKGKLLGSGVTTIVGDAGESNINNGVYYLPISGINTVTSLTFAGMVKSISGINNCKGLKEVTALSVETIDSRAFKECISLEAVNLNNVQTLGDSAFSGCTSLYRVTDLSFVTSVGANVFENCTKLTDLTLAKADASVTFTGALGAQNLTYLTVKGHATAPATIFKGCKSLKSVNVEGTFVVNNDAKNVSNVQTIESIKVGGELILGGLFPGFDITEVTVDGNLAVSSELSNASSYQGTIGTLTVKGNANLESSAFSGNNVGVEDLEIDGNATIAHSAFASNTHLKKINVAGDVKLTAMTSAQSAFAGCTALEYVSFGSATIDSNTFPDSADLKYFALTKNSTTQSRIGDGSFENKLKLESVLLTNAIVGNNAFFGCGVLSSVTFDGGTIKSEAFRGCKSLEAVTINSCDEIGTEAFLDVTSLTTLTLNATKIGESAFKGCANAVLVKSQDSNILRFAETESIGNDAFNGCTSLFKGYDFIVMPKVTTIGDNAFSGVNFASTADQNGLYLKSIKTIGQSAFANMSNLKLVRLGENCASIGSKAFWGCAMSKDGEWTSDTEGPEANDSGLFISAAALPTLTPSETAITDVFNNTVFLYCLEDSYSAYQEGWGGNSKIKVWAGLSNADDYWVE